MKTGMTASSFYLFVIRFSYRLGKLFIGLIFCTGDGDGDIYLLPQQTTSLSLPVHDWFNRKNIYRQYST